MCRLLSQVKEATQVHRLGAFLLTVLALLAFISVLAPAGVGWG